MARRRPSGPRPAPQAPWLELPNPFAGEGGVIRLLEPADCDREAVIDRVLSDTYGKPFVIEEDGERSLYFTRAFIQSGMRVADPVALDFAYTRKMMAFLLFVPAPRSVLLLGLGGGSLAKFCHRHLPGTRLVAVEVDPHVLAFREQFLVPPDDARFRVVRADAAGYVAQCEETHDVVLLDAFDQHGVAPSLCTREFYEDVRGCLERRGVLVANLVGDKAERMAHLGMIRRVFGDNLLLLPVENDGNHVVFLFRDPAFEPRWRWIDAQAKALGARYVLDFPRFAGKLERSRKLGYARRALQAPPVP